MSRIDLQSTKISFTVITSSHEDISSSYTVVKADLELMRLEKQMFILLHVKFKFNIFDINNIFTNILTGI